MPAMHAPTCAAVWAFCTKASRTGLTWGLWSTFQIYMLYLLDQIKKFLGHTMELQRFHVWALLKQGGHIDSPAVGQIQKPGCKGGKRLPP